MGGKRSVLGIGVGMLFIIVGVFVGEFIGLFVTGSMPDLATGRFPEDANVTGFSLWNVFWSMPTAFIGTCFTSLIVRRRIMRHAMVIAGLLVAGGVFFIFAGRSAYAEAGLDLPAWYLPALPAAGAFGALCAGWLNQKVIKDTRSE